MMNTEPKKKSTLRRFQEFLSGYRGKVILNYAYSWGAAIVILGALFKLTHMPGANMMLWIGMGTEVLVFFVSAFDLPAVRSSGGGDSQANVNINSVAVAASTAAPIVASSGTPIAASTPLVTPEVKEVTTAYLEQLKEMTEMINRFTKQAESLSHDAEQMSTLNKNLSGINAIYEMQLRSVSSQIGTIDQVHEQTRKMARQIEELNAVYARMLDAMNANR